MLGYGAFARFYDLSIEHLYVEHRAAAAQALELAPGCTVLDVPAGTGQSLDLLSAAVAPGGKVIGVDFSGAMLAKARARVEARRLPGVHLAQADARTLDAPTIARTVGAEVRIDRIHVFLGLSVIPDWEAAFSNLWGLLAPGGRCAIFDVHADPPGLQGRIVQWTAGADLRRRTWEPLRRLAVGYREVELQQSWQHGGRIFLAVGARPFEAA